MSEKNKGITKTVLVLIAFAALITGLFVSQHWHQSHKIDISQFNGTVLKKPRPVEAFNLQGIDGKPFNNETLKGQWTMVFFGFTNCGYLCPTTMTELAKTYQLLEQQHVTQLPKVVLISIDPQRDSLEKLKTYVALFNPQFYAARGEDKDIKKMTREFGIAYAKIAAPADKNPEDYDVQHSGTVMLFNPQGQLSAFFTTPQQADLLAKDYSLLVK